MEWFKNKPAAQGKCHFETAALCNTIVDGVLETLLQYLIRGGMSQLVDRSTEKILAKLTRVESPVWLGIFLPFSTSSVDSLTVSHASTLVRK